MTTELTKGIHWVGYVDWGVRDFHGYSTDRGATYNAYLVQDEKTALIDTVKGPYAQSLLQNVAALTDPEKIDYVVCNHGEPDHSSALPAVMAALPNATLLCSKKAVDSLGAYYDTSDWKMQIVGTGDAVSLGSRTLAFLETPMVHWPDSMMTYIPEEKLLFSMDGFGQHFASNTRFDDENALPTLLEEARIYYANIVTPYSSQVVKTMTAAAGLDIEMIAPSHGVIWRSHIAEILQAYRNWSQGKAKKKVLVVFDTMWGSTAKLADAIVEGASAVPSVEVKLIAIRTSDLTEIATEMLESAGIAFGSPTLNRGMMPMAAAVLTYAQGLRFTGRAGFAFGSYGWSIGGPEALDKGLKECKWEVLNDPIKSKFKPTEDVLAKCREAGRLLAVRAVELSEAAGYEPLLID
ncbi:MAG: MBL fold metallo-hydrolase [Victivallales bacterium]|nr:MBL fold metallo-hydrolase [Victivallales bacterium]